jgi:hypothetical protein
MLQNSNLKIIIFNKLNKTENSSLNFDNTTENLKIIYILSLLTPKQEENTDFLMKTVAMT